MCAVICTTVPPIFKLWLCDCDFRSWFSTQGYHSKSWLKAEVTCTRFIKGFKSSASTSNGLYYISNLSWFITGIRCKFECNCCWHGSNSLYGMSESFCWLQFNYLNMFVWHLFFTVSPLTYIVNISRLRWLAVQTLRANPPVAGRKSVSMCSFVVELTWQRDTNRWQAAALIPRLMSALPMCGAYMSVCFVRTLWGARPLCAVHTWTCVMVWGAAGNALALLKGGPPSHFHSMGHSQRNFTLY